MTTKKFNTYKLTLEAVALKEESETLPSLELEFENHDNLFKIIELIQQKNLFENDNQAKEFAIGLKLFSEVMLRNKEHSLFEDFRPAFTDFMKKLKSK